jgi:cysteinyl-tRNA synthetase
MSMQLKLYDTLSREKRVFRPLDPARVRMYVCGPTVYDFAHIGNARPVIVFDILFRLLRHLAKQGVWDGGKGGTDVVYVRNITDVDDKIIARAAEQYPDLPLNAAIKKVTAETEAQFHADVAALGCLPPTHEPRATEHIEEMKALIERLIASGHAYVAADHVLFSVPSMPDYGHLSRRSLDEMVAGARVEVAPYKKNPMDFVLWKPSKEGEPAWPSPAGIATPGRPGWHIECSAMSWKHLGETFDIHGGGIDLVFPHHENEIAQSRCAFHTPLMANFWLHNGFLQVEGKKMAKSEGNFVTIRDLLNEWPGEVLRFNMLRTHYRQPIDWTSAGVDESHKILWDWYADLENVPAGGEVPESFLACLADDLNTPAAVAELHKLRRSADPAKFAAALHLIGLKGSRKNIRRKVSAAISQTLPGPSMYAEARVEPDRGQTLSGPSNHAAGWVEPDRAEVEKLVAARDAARKARNFTEADRIRDELAKMGVVLHDTKDGTTWEIAR